MTPEPTELHRVLQVDIPPALLELALTHPSAVGEGIERTLLSNQRMEFLGDAVLGAVVAAQLYRTEPNLPEGDLTQQKAAAVQKRSLDKAAKRLGLGRFIKLSSGAEAAGGRDRAGILSDALEAIIGAIFLAHGFEVASDFILRVLAEELSEVAAHAVNVKNLLQEKSQAAGLGTPVYRTAASGGPAHRREFSSEVLIQQETRGRGRGASKKEAEQFAAQAALEALESQK